MIARQSSLLAVGGKNTGEQVWTDTNKTSLGIQWGARQC